MNESAQKLEVIKEWIEHVGVDVSSLDVEDIDIIHSDIIEIVEETKEWIKGTHWAPCFLGHFTCVAVEGYLCGYFEDS